jgi:tyrosinase
MKGTFVHRPDSDPNATDIDVNTPLEPFWKSQSDFATSVDATSTAAYGYTYPEIAAAGPVSADQLSEVIHQTVGQLYGTSNIFSAFTVQKNPSHVAMEALRQGVEKATISPVVKDNAIHIPAHAAFTAVPKAQRILNAPFGGPQGGAVPPKSIPEPKPSGPQGGAVPPHQSLPESHRPSGPQGGVIHPAASQPDYVVTPENYKDWIANVTLEKYALGGSGRVVFFLGPVEEIPANPHEWLTCPIYVGSYTIFATNPETSGCKNCKDQADKKLRVGGTVHLTKALIRRRCPLTGAAPVHYLTENLHWRMCDVEQNEIPSQNVPSLKVVVQSAGYLTPHGILGRRPERGPWTRHAPITSGKAGGVNHAHEF